MNITECARKAAEKLVKSHSPLRSYTDHVAELIEQAFEPMKFVTCGECEHLMEDQEEVGVGVYNRWHWCGSADAQVRGAIKLTFGCIHGERKKKCPSGPNQDWD